MGADPDGILFMGFPLPSLVVSYDDLNEEWAEDHQPPAPEDRSDLDTIEWDEWRSRLREWEGSLENVQIDWSGGESCEQYYVHVAGLQKSVEWNELLPVSQADIAIPVGAKELLHEFCDRFNLPKKEPGWYLAARYF